MQQFLKLTLIVFIALAQIPICAQFSAEENINRNEDIEVASDSIKSENNSFFDIFTGKPGKAAFYSLIVPGGGQYYNRRYWKIPLVLGVEGAAIYWFVLNNNRLNTWQAGYIGLLTGEFTEFQGVTQASTAKILRDRALKNKEYAYIFIILAHLLNVFDAFIDRHLIDFDIDDDLSFRPLPPMHNYALDLQPKIWAGITIKIPLSSR